MLQTGERQMARYHHYDYDQMMLVPVLLEEQLTVGRKDPLKGKQVSADTGYYSVSNPKACKDQKVETKVPEKSQYGIAAGSFVLRSAPWKHHR
jgi:hypothetical protein